jgi:hypothetical protein
LKRAAQFTMARVDTHGLSPFDKRVRLFVAALALLLVSNASGRPLPEAKMLAKVTPLPVALDPNFEFRKTKIFALTEKAPAAALRKKVTKTGEQATNASSSSKSTSVVQEASITFERQYRLFGAVTNVDQHERFGIYFDFFWRAKRPADLTVRLEYRQEKLHAHVQAQEISCPNARGSHKSEFKVIGDDYFDGGRVTAWRCLLLENGRVVAETRSFLWS